MKKRFLLAVPSLLPCSSPHPFAALCWGHLGCKFPSWRRAEPQVQFVQLLCCLSGARMHGRAVGAGWERGPREQELFLMSDAPGWAVCRGWWL